MDQYQKIANLVEENEPLLQQYSVELQIEIVKYLIVYQMQGLSSHIIREKCNQLTDVIGRKNGVYEHAPSADELSQLSELVDGMKNQSNVQFIKQIADIAYLLNVKIDSSLTLNQLLETTSTRLRLLKK